MRADGQRIILTAIDDELDELIGYVAAEANHETTRRVRSASTPHSTHSATLVRAADPMALPELDVARVDRWCAARVPEHARHQVRVEGEIAPRHLTIVQRRAPWREDFGPEWTSFHIARVRYTTATKSWTLLA